MGEVVRWWDRWGRVACAIVEGFGSGGPSRSGGAYVFTGYWFTVS